MANITRIKASDKPDEAPKVVEKTSTKDAKTKQAARKLQKQSAKRKARKLPAPIRFILWLLTPLRKLGRYVADSFRELKQVHWPDRKETWRLTISVISYIIGATILLTLLDTLFTYLTKLFLGD